MKCPYCQAELNGEPYEFGEFHESGYGDVSYWNEFRCVCPECGEQFRWFENYRRIDDDALRMDE